MDEYIGFNGEFLRMVRDMNIPAAKGLLDQLLWLMNPRQTQVGKRTRAQQSSVDRVRDALKNIFKIYLDSDLQPLDNAFRANLSTLRTNLQRVRSSFDAFFKKVYVERENPAFAAWASNNFSDTSIYFSSRYLDLSALDQAVTLVHERAHTALMLPGHPATGDSPVGVVPHEGAQIPFNLAIRNAYCYEWLAISLHPAYSPQRYRDASIIGQP